MAKEKESTRAKRIKHHSAPLHKKVFDVVPPGKAPAAPNSRSVVPSGKPPVPDDQFVPGAPKLRAHDPNEKRPLLEHRKPIELKAPADHDIPVDPDGKPASESEKPAVPAVVDVPEADTSPQPSESEPDQPAPVSSVPDITEEVPVTPEPDQVIEPLEPAAATNTSPEPEEPSPGQLAVEQMVEANAEGPDVPAPEAPANVPPKKSIDDLLAESGAPTLESESEPPQGLLVSHHTERSSWIGPMLLFLAVLIIAALTLNFLLDAEVIQTKLDLPHTDLL